MREVHCTIFIIDYLYFLRGRGVRERICLLLLRGFFSNHYCPLYETTFEIKTIWKWFSQSIKGYKVYPAKMKTDIVPYVSLLFIQNISSFLITSKLPAKLILHNQR